MKKLMTILLVAATALAFSCSDKYDDTALREKLEALGTQFQQLQSQINTANSNITSLQTLITAVGNNMLVSAVTPTANGYTVTLVGLNNNTQTVTINHGTNGKDGTAGKDAPVIGVKQDTDGIYYWTITTAGTTTWLYSSGTTKIPVTQKGTDGKDGITPVLGVDAEGYWTINYGNGAVQLLGTDGKPIKAAASTDSFFKSISMNEMGDLVVVLANDQTIVIPQRSGLGIIFSCSPDVAVPVKVGQTAEVGFTLKEGDAGTLVETIAYGVEAKVVRSNDDPAKGTILITVPDEFVDGCKVLVFVSDRKSVTITECLYPYVGEDPVLYTNLPDNAISISADNQDFTFDISANNGCTVVVDELSTWLTVAPETKAVVTTPYAFHADKNEAGERTANITITSDVLSLVVSVVQAAGQPAELKTLFADDFSWVEYGNTFDIKSNYVGSSPGSGEPGGSLVTGSSSKGTIANGAEVLRAYNRENCLKMASASGVGRYTTPELSLLGEGTKDITVTAKVLNWNNQPGAIAIGTCHSGATGTQDYTNVYVGDTAQSIFEFGTPWGENPFQNWYTVCVTIKNVTAAHRISFLSAGTPNYNVFFIDDIKITEYDAEAVNGVTMNAVEPGIGTEGVVMDGNVGDYTIVVNHTVPLAMPMLPEWMTIKDITQQEVTGGVISTITITVKANTTEAPRTAIITLAAIGSAITKDVTVTQPVKPTPTPGAVIFEDDFSWSYAKYPGDTSSTEFIVATDNGGAGETRMDLWQCHNINAEALTPTDSGYGIIDPKGWTTDCDSWDWTTEIESESRSLFVYSRNGFIKIGKTLAGGALYTPELSDIVGTQDITVRFKALVYRSDISLVKVEAIGGGTVEMSEFVVGEAWNANKYQTWYNVTCKVTGATPQTKIGIANAISNADQKTKYINSNRFFLDDVVITISEPTDVSGVVMGDVDDNILATDLSSVTMIGDAAEFNIKLFRSVSDYTVSISDDAKDWLRQILSRAPLAVDQLRFSIDANLGDQTRTGIITITSGEFVQTVEVSQLVGVVRDKYCTFPTTISMNADRKDLNTATLMWDNPTILGDGTSPAKIEYILNPNIARPSFAASLETKSTYCNIISAWVGDCWQITLPVENLEAGTIIEYKNKSYASKTGLRYWMSEYYEDGVWKPIGTVTTEPTTNTQYSLELLNSATEKSGTFTLANAITNGELKIRFRIVANIQASGTPLAQPNTGTNRMYTVTVTATK